MPDLIAYKKEITKGEKEISKIACREVIELLRTLLGDNNILKWYVLAILKEELEKLLED